MEINIEYTLNNICLNQCINDRRTKLEIYKTIKEFIGSHWVRYEELEHEKAIRLKLCDKHDNSKVYKITVMKKGSYKSISHYIGLPSCPYDSRYVIDLCYVIQAILFDLNDPNEYIDSYNSKILRSLKRAYRKALNFYSDKFIMAIGGTF